MWILWLPTQCQHLSWSCRCLKMAPHHMIFICGAIRCSCYTQVSYQSDYIVLLYHGMLCLCDPVFRLLMKYSGWKNGLERWIEFCGRCFVAHVQYWRSWIIWYYSYALTYTIVYTKIVICWPSQIVHQMRCLLAVHFPLLWVCHYCFWLQSQKSIVAWLTPVPRFGSGFWKKIVFVVYLSCSCLISTCLVPIPSLSKYCSGVV